MEKNSKKTTDNTDRKNWMALLAEAAPSDLEAALEHLDGTVTHTPVKAAQTGIYRIQARCDGSGPRFHLGEATVSRCILEVNGCYQGAAWVMGADRRHAELAALFDGLLQDPRYHDDLQEKLVNRLLEKETTKHPQAQQKTTDGT